jgi:hypothetical protein
MNERLYFELKLVTMDLTLAILIAFILALIPTLMLVVGKIEKRRKQDQKTRILERLYKATYILTWLLFLIVTYKEYINYNDKKHANKRSEEVATRDSLDVDTVKGTVRMIPYKIDSSTDLLKGIAQTNYDSLFRKLQKGDVLHSFPLKVKLDLAPPLNNQGNPVILSTGSDSIMVVIEMANYGNSMAKNLSDKVVRIGRIGLQRYFTYSFSSAANRSMEIIPESLKKTVYADVYSYTFSKISEISFLYFKMKFSNEDGKRLDSVQKIFYINNLSVRESTSLEYDSIYNLLYEKKLL